jgi:hypothetical protein
MYVLDIQMTRRACYKGIRFTMNSKQIELNARRLRELQAVDVTRRTVEIPTATATATESVVKSKKINASNNQSMIVNNIQCDVVVSFD